jgi:hypothetical protein
MSAKGHSRRLRGVRVMSAYPPTTTVMLLCRERRFVPITAITASRILRQFDINVGNVILANMPRVAPPNTYSRRREWP